MRRGKGIAARLAGWVLAGLLGVGSVAAQGLQPVDVELALVAGAHDLLTDDEIRIQRASYAMAIESPEVQAAIASGLHRRIAVLYMEWAGPASQPVIVDWMVLEGPASTSAFAAALRRMPRVATGSGGLAPAVERAALLIDSNAFAGRRRVIDLSGDGPNRAARDARTVRDRTIQRGITINALAVNRPGRSELSGTALVRNYQQEVAGGWDSFVAMAPDRPSLPHAIRRKLVQEIGGPSFLQDLERRWGARAWSALSGPR
ncbi:DUF1194 domain-containing protein [Segnochrobactraceae bacterium EtOH-i3]